MADGLLQIHTTADAATEALNFCNLLVGSGVQVVPMFQDVLKETSDPSVRSGLSRRSYRSYVAERSSTYTLLSSPETETRVRFGASARFVGMGDRHFDDLLQEFCSTDGTLLSDVLPKQRAIDTTRTGIPLPV